jgi:hypothetical protein
MAQEGQQGNLQGTYIIQDSSFLPVRFYVGDNVELRLRLEAPGGELRPPSDTSWGNWIVLRDISCTKIKGQIWEVRIFFTTFQPGRHVLPDIDLGGIVLTNLRAETRSILEDKGQEKPAGQKGQLLLPGTLRTLIVTALVILLMPLILYKSTKGGLAVLKSYKTLRQRKLPHSRILRALDGLQARMKDYDAAAFFTHVTSLLREYFYGRLHIPAQTSTTLEIQQLLPDALSRAHPSGDIRLVTSGVIDLFHRADYVKFGRQSASRSEMADVLEDVFQIIDKIEEVAEYVES